MISRRKNLGARAFSIIDRE